MKSKAIIGLLGVLIFLLGGIAGAVSHSLYQNHLRVNIIKASAQPPIDIVGGLAKELDLDGEQIRSLRIIFDEHKNLTMDISKKMWPKYQALNKEAEPQYQALYKETEQKIKAILNDDQKIRYEEFLKKVQSRPFPENPGNRR